MLFRSISVAADGSVTFITHTGRWVRAIPVLHDSVAFLTGLQSFGLTSFVVLPSGNLRVPIADTGMYYSGRPSLLAIRSQLRSNVGLDVMRMPVAINYGIHGNNRFIQLRHNQRQFIRCLKMRY